MQAQSDFKGLAHDFQTGFATPGNVTQILIATTVYALSGILIGRLSDFVFKPMDKSTSILQLAAIPFIYKYVSQILTSVFKISEENLRYSSIVFIACIFATQQFLIAKLLKTLSPIIPAPAQTGGYY